MAVQADRITTRIIDALPDAEVVVRDLVGDGDHYAVRVVSAHFEGRSRLERHRLIHAALREELGEALHALTIETATPGA